MFLGKILLFFDVEYYLNMSPLVRDTLYIISNNVRNLVTHYRTLMTVFFSCQLWLILQRIFFSNIKASFHICYQGIYEEVLQHK